MAAPTLGKSAARLEDDLQRYLNLPGRSCPVRLLVCRGYNSKQRLPNQVAQVCRVCARIQEVRMIQNVVAFETKFRFHTFRQAHLLGQRHVPIPEARPIELIAFVVRAKSPRRIYKRTLIRNVGIARARRCRATGTRRSTERISYLITPGGDSGSLRVQSSSHLKRMPGLRGEDTVELESLHNLPR